MSYDSLDISIQNGSPVHLILITYDNTDYRFTNIPGGYYALGYTWDYKSVSIGDIISTEEINKNNLDLEFARDDSLANSILSTEQNFTTSVTLFRGYHNDPSSEFITFWKGRVSSKSVKKNAIKLTCESIYSSLKRPGLNGKFSKVCRHALYGRGCNVSLTDASFYIEGQVDSVSADGLTISISEASTKSDGYFIGGMIKTSDSVYRFINAHSGSIITISKSYVGISVSDTIRIYAGCDRSTSICLSRFDNLDNYGGFPYSRSINPFGGSSIA